MRKQFTTTIDDDISKKFKDKCKLENISMNDVLEAFMLEYINGRYTVVEERTVKLKNTGNKK